MRVTENRIPILAAILMALVFSAIPHCARAQTTPFSMQDCITNMQNAQTKRAQDLTAANYKIFSNAPLVSMKAAYCWTTISNLYTVIGALTSAANGLNALGAAIWGIIQTILNTIITSIVNSICTSFASAVSSLFSFINSLLCLPLPHFNLSFNLGSFGGAGGGACSGINLLSLTGGALGGVRQSAPSAWGIWGMTNQHN